MQPCLFSKTLRALVLLIEAEFFGLEELIEVITALKRYLLAESELLAIGSDSRKREEAESVTVEIAAGVSGWMVSIYVGGRDDGHFLVQHLQAAYGRLQFGFPGDYCYYIREDFEELAKRLRDIQATLASHGYVLGRQLSDPNLIYSSSEKSQWTFVKRG